MAWAELDLQTRQDLPMSAEREALLNEVRNSVRPVITREVDRGDKGIEPVQFKEVRSPGLFEAQFARKQNDVVFHFWPWGFALAEKRGEPRPAFQPGMRVQIREAFVDIYGDSEFLSVTEDDWDREMGSITAIVRGQGAKQFWYDLAVKVVTQLHKSLGGKNG